MNLILVDELTDAEFEILRQEKIQENTKVVFLKNFDLNEILGYKNITFYLGLKLGIVSTNFINFVENLINSNLEKTQIFVIFVEKYTENAKISIDFLNEVNKTYGANFCVKAEISRENLADEIDFEKNKSAEILQNNVKDNNVTIYTDGACSGNPGAGGWGAILFHGSYKKEISGFEAETTNNKMEITAVIKALEMLKSPCVVELYSDSAYVVNAIKLGWLENWKNNNWLGSDKKQVKNIEYWKRLDELMHIHRVNFNKVKGHADNEFNNRCDELATGEIAKNANCI